MSVKHLLTLVLWAETEKPAERGREALRQVTSLSARKKWSEGVGGRGVIRGGVLGCVEVHNKKKSGWVASSVDGG